MYETSHTDLRVIYSAVLILLLDPLKLSVLPNLLHRKHMLQLQVTLVVWIVFVINNAEDGTIDLTRTPLLTRKLSGEGRRKQSSTLSTRHVLWVQCSAPEERSSELLLCNLQPYTVSELALL